MTDKESASSPNYRVPALDKALDIIELLSNSDQRHSMVEIARQLNLGSTQIFRILRVLEERGYIHRESDETYQLTNRLFNLAMNQPHIKDLLSAARQTMLELSQSLINSTHLCVISDGSIVVIYVQPSAGEFSFSVKLGHHRPLHRSTSGMALMAFQSPKRQAELLRLSKLAATKPADDDKIKAELQQVLEEGVCARPSRILEGIIDYSVPILNHEGQAVAALGCPALTHVANDTPTPEHIKSALKLAASQISNNLNHAV
ncbi:MAG: IclR family transcriptional regulator [Gammaproteobacteria bacterium]|nr:IclR family transcriptional regulator [Gammaproteobacteria bacterium]